MIEAPDATLAPLDLTLALFADAEKPQLFPWFAESFISTGCCLDETAPPASIAALRRNHREPSKSDGVNPVFIGF
jgi:hypothetical protein